MENKNKSLNMFSAIKLKDDKLLISAILLSLTTSTNLTVWHMNPRRSDIPKLYHELTPKMKACILDCSKIWRTHKYCTQGDVI